MTYTDTLLRRHAVWAITLLLIAGFAGCSQSGDSRNAADSSSSAENNESGLTAFEKKHGIGPVKEPMKLEEINPKLAAKGEKIFTMNCSSCHKMDERYVGPAQRDVVDQRTPAYIMNMILNPDEMVKKHPVAKKLLAKYMTPMPNQNVSREEARAILEYFRYMNKHPNADSVTVQ